MSRKGESCTQLCNTPCPLLPRLCWARVPGDQGTVGGSEGLCAPVAAGDRGGPSGMPQVPSGENPLPGAGCTWLQARGSPGVRSSSVQWLRAQVPGLAGEEAPLVALGCLPALPAPSFFFPPLFRRHQLQLLQSVKNVKEIFPRQERVTTFTALGPFWRFSFAPLTSTRAPLKYKGEKSQSGGELQCSLSPGFVIGCFWRTGQEAELWAPLGRPWCASKVLGTGRLAARDPRSSRCRTGPRRSQGARSRSAGAWAAEQLSASAPPERLGTRTSSVTPSSWLRRLLLLLPQQRGGQERLLGVSSPARLSRCRLLDAKEKSLCWWLGRF